MKKIREWFSNPLHRKYVYSIVPALTTILIGYGILSESEAGNIVALVGAVLAIPVGALALNNTPSGDDE